MSQGEPTPREAATVVVARQAAEGPEVLLLRRHARSGFAADTWVFPGGVVDPEDRRLDAARWEGLDPAAAGARFAAPPDLVLGFHVAAVRETFEEAGLLLARHRDGRPVDVAAPGYAAVRARLGDRGPRSGWAPWLAAEDLVLELDRLTYLSRWVTPAQEPKRYDTAFFLAQAPTGQVAAHDRVETTDQRWTSPREALAAHRAGALRMMFPTVRTLEALDGAASVGELVEGARAQARVPRVQPHVERGPDGPRILHPDDADYPHERYGGRR